MREEIIKCDRCKAKITHSEVFQWRYMSRTGKIVKEYDFCADCNYNMQYFAAGRDLEAAARIAGSLPADRGR